MVKATTPGALAALRSAGVAMVMLTGDNHVTAEAVARSLRIGEAEAKVLQDRRSTVAAVTPHIILG